MSETIVLFCQLKEPTEDLVKDFLANCYEDESDRVVFNWFCPARRDPTLIPGCSDTPIRLSVDSFHGETIEDLRQFVLNFKGKSELKHLNHEQFAVLDEEGVANRTVVLHYYHIPPLDPELSPSDPRQQEENPEPDGDMNPKWLSWRIKWKYAYIMTANIAESPPVLYQAYMANPEDFTDEDGVFDEPAAVRGAH